MLKGLMLLDGAGTKVFKLILNYATDLLNKITLRKYKWGYYVAFGKILLFFNSLFRF